MTAHLTVEHTDIEAPAGNGFVQVGDPACTTDAEQCCGAVTTCLPSGQHLRVEHTTYDFPAGSRLIRRYCEVGKLCCAGSGTGSGTGIGSGQCQTCCPDVYPYYLFNTACCASPLPYIIAGIDFGGDCTNLNGLWDAATHILDPSDVYPDGGWLQQRDMGGVSIGLIIYCKDGQLKADVRCNNITIHDPVWFTINLTVTSCCPFAASGTATAPASACCASGTVTLDLSSPAGDRGLQSGGGSGAGCLVLLQLEEWELPDGTVIHGPSCITDPTCCGEMVIVPCCDRPIPKQLYAVIDAPNCPELRDRTIPISFTQIGPPTWKWRGIVCLVEGTAPGQFGCRITFDLNCVGLGWEINVKFETTGTLDCTGAVAQTCLTAFSAGAPNDVQKNCQGPLYFTAGLLLSYSDDCGGKCGQECVGPINVYIVD